MFGIPWGLIAYAGIALAAAAFYGTWHHKVFTEGRADGIALQFKADKPMLAACEKHGNKEPERCAAFIDAVVSEEAKREAELASCSASAQRQNAALEVIATQTAAALKASADVRAKQAATQKSFDDRQRELHAQAASTQTKVGECKDELAQVNRVLDSYRPRSLR